MAASPILLVADDLAVIASVKRVLAREGYECVLATNAADAIIAWGHSLPGLVLLQPSVESERGGVVLEELANHPDAQLLRVVLLGESVPGFPWPVEPLPLDAAGFAQTIADNYRSADRVDGWRVLETTPPEKPEPSAEPPHEAPDEWRATRPASTLSEATGGVTGETELPNELPTPEGALADEDEPATPTGAQPTYEAPAERADRSLLFDEGEAPPVSSHGALHAASSELSEETSASAEAQAQADAAVAEAAAQAEASAQAEWDAATQAQFDAEQAEAAVQAELEAAAQAQFDAEQAAAAQAQFDAEQADAAAQAQFDAEQAAAAVQAELEAAAQAQFDAEQAAAAQAQFDAEQADAAAQAQFDAEQAAAAAQAQFDAEQAAAAAQAQFDAEQADAAAQAQFDAEQADAAARAQFDAEQAAAAAQAELEAAAQAQFDAEQAAAAQAPTTAAPSHPGDLDDRLFNDLPDLEAAMHADVEAQVRASVESTLAAQPMDDELQRLEDEVRAEAQRRRVAREEKARAVPTLSREAPEPAPLPESAPFESSESDFSGLADDAGSPPAPPTLPSRANEMLARAEQLLLEGRAAAEARRREADAESKRQRAEVEAAERRVEHAEGLVARERDARALAEETARQLENALAAEQQRATELEAALAASRAELERARQEHEEARLEVDGLSSHLETQTTRIEQLEQALADAQARHEQVLAEAEARADTELRRAELAEQSLTDARTTSETDTSRAEAAEQALAEVAQARDDAHAQLAAATARIAALEADLGATTDKLDEANTERDALKTQLGVTQGDLERTTGELDRALGEIAGLTRAAEEARADLAAKDKSVEELVTRAEAAEDRAALAQEKAESLEKQAVAPLALPGNRTVGVPRTGSVDLEGLAHLVGQLVLAQADGRLELGIAGGTRTLWFKRGAVIAAESTLEYESLVDRARRDGLIDARQEAELRMLKSATPREQLEAMKARGVIRDIESVPLVQRYTEQTTLEAFTEPATNYRLADDPPADSVLIATVPRATLPMLAESLRRAIPPDVLLERLGGGEAVPESTDSELDLRALGFSERERKMLTWVDGEATVEDLSLASGLKPDVAFRALLVAKLLGAVTLSTPEKPAPAADPDLDVRRLEAKYDEVQDADYFTILGLPRSAGGDDVQRAFQRLGGEFDPLRFSGHPDPSLQQRAQVVYRLLEEAARALEDDRRRAEYARHLLD